MLSIVSAAFGEANTRRAPPHLTHNRCSYSFQRSIIIISFLSLSDPLRYPSSGLVNLNESIVALKCSQKSAVLSVEPKCAQRTSFASGCFSKCSAGRRNAGLDTVSRTAEYACAGVISMSSMVRPWLSAISLSRRYVSQSAFPSRIRQGFDIMDSLFDLSMRERPALRLSHARHTRSRCRRLRTREQRHSSRHRMAVRLARLGLPAVRTEDGMVDVVLARMLEREDEVHGRLPVTWRRSCWCSLLLGLGLRSLGGGLVHLPGIAQEVDEPAVLLELSIIA